MNGADVPAVNILAHDPTIFPRVKKEPSFAMNAFKFARNNEVCDSLVQFLVKIGKTDYQVCGETFGADMRQSNFRTLSSPQVKGADTVLEPRTFTIDEPEARAQLSTFAGSKVIL